ncbi:MAG: TCR/Tet family MFS transporter [Polyangiaceae bacterium]|nr:TCR/Tet family MFS transporter [Polyangiaceae bacterium]
MEPETPTAANPTPEIAQGPTNAAFAFIVVTVLLDILAVGIVIPVLPKLIEIFVKGDTAQAAMIAGVFLMVWEGMQFIFSPLVGSLSDRFGRRPIILLSNAGLGLDYVLMATAPSLGFLFLGRILSGITAASFSTANAYIADVLPAEKRAKAFGMLGAAFGLGFIVGPAFGGVLGEISPRLPFWVAAALSLLNALYGVFVLPESLPLDKRDAFVWKSANPLGALHLLRKYPETRGLSAAVFFFNVAHFVLQSIFVLYAGHHFGWGPRDVGLALTVVGVCSAIVQGGLVGPIVARIGERNAIRFGTVCGIFAFAAYGLAPSGPLFFIGMPLMALWGISGPSIQKVLSERVGPSEQGRLQGSLTSIVALAGILSPLVFAKAFAATVGKNAWIPWTGFPFYLSSVALGIGLIFAIRGTSSTDSTRPEPN